MGLTGRGEVWRMRGSGDDEGPGYGVLQEVRAYWEALRPEGGLPDRAGIDPRGMERALEHVFLLERIATGLARFRIAGMHLTVLMGMEVRGMPLSALFAPPDRERLQGVLEQVFATPAILELALEGERGIGRPSIEARMLLLPVRGDGGTCDRALGCVVTVGPVGRTPRRFAIARHVLERISPVPADAAGGSGSVAAPQVPGPRPTPVPPVAVRPMGFAAPAVPFAGPRQTGPSPSVVRRAHLRLVKSDD